MMKVIVCTIFLKIPVLTEFKCPRLYINSPILMFKVIDHIFIMTIYFSSNTSVINLISYVQKGMAPFLIKRSLDSIRYKLLDNLLKINCMAGTLIGINVFL